MFAIMTRSASTSCCGYGYSCSATTPEHRRSSAANGCCSAGWRRSRSAPSGRLASQDMARLAAFSVLVSSGTVLAAIGMGQVGVTGGALFYLVSSTLGISAFFLLIELVERGREPGADVLAVTREAYGEDDDVDDEEEVGIAIPATMGMLGVGLHRLRACHRGAAAAVRLHRQVRAADGGAQPAGRPGRRSPGGIMGVARRADPVRIGDASSP